MSSFHCQIRIELPGGIDPEVRADLLTRDRAYLLSLQRDETLKHAMTAVGESVEFLVFEAADHAQLHDLLAARPLFPYLQVELTPLVSSQEF